MQKRTDYPLLPTPYPILPTPYPILPLLLLFLALGAHQLSLPGLHYDEAKEAGLNAMQLLTGQPVTAFRGATVALGPWRLPLMVQDYIGALNVYLAVPFLAVGGVNVVALRWLPLLTGGLTLLLTWRVARMLGGSPAAHIAALLLAVNPTFVFWSRQGIFVTNLTALFLVAGLLTGLRWWRWGRPADLYLTALFWGLGLYAKLLFLWAIGAMVAVAVIARLCSPSRRKPFAPFAPFVMLAFCFLLPLLPLFIFNWQTGGTLASVLGNLDRSYYGVNNREYLSNLVVRLGQLQPLLRGDHLWYLGGVFANRWAPYLAAGTLLLAIVGGLWTRRPTPLIPVALLLLIVAQSAFTVSDLFITHYALAVPLVPLAVGLTLAGHRFYPAPWRRIDPALGHKIYPAPWRRIDPALGHKIYPALWHKIYPAVMVIIIILWAVGDLQTTVRYHQALGRTGGHSAHSSAIYDLAGYLEANATGPVVALDWGIDAPVRFLTVGQIEPIEVFGYERLDGPDAGFVERIRPFLEDPATLYVAHTPEDTVFRGRVEALGALAAERGGQLQEVGQFAEQSGRPLFLLYRVAFPSPSSGQETCQ